jgi:hypothetical protein
MTDFQPSSSIKRRNPLERHVPLGLCACAQEVMSFQAKEARRLSQPRPARSRKRHEGAARHRSTSASSSTGTWPGGEARVTDWRATSPSRLIPSATYQEGAERERSARYDAHFDLNNPAGFCKAHQRTEVKGFTMTDDDGR